LTTQPPQNPRQSTLPQQVIASDFSLPSYAHHGTSALGRAVRLVSPARPNKRCADWTKSPVRVAPAGRIPVARRRA